MENCPKGTRAIQGDEWLLFPDTVEIFQISPKDEAKHFHQICPPRAATLDKTKIINDFE